MMAALCKTIRILFASVIILALAYIPLEFFSLEILSKVAPPISHFMVDEGARVLLQNSKDSVVPEHYVALLGDSYAMGLGDGYYAQSGSPFARYGTQYLLHERTGLDVVAFGTAGAGSVRAMVSEAVYPLARINRSFRYHIEAPHTIIVYFYEGNDLEDNVLYLQQADRSIEKIDWDRVTDRTYLKEYLLRVALEKNDSVLHANQAGWRDNLFFYNYLTQFFPLLADSARMQIDAWLHPSPAIESSGIQRSPVNYPGRYGWDEPGKINKARINGKVEQLPDSLQGPSMHLNEAEFAVALLSFDVALEWLRDHFPQSGIAVVYIPSVISSYDIASATVHVQGEMERRFEFATPLLYAHSDKVAGRIRQITEQQGLQFLDARPVIRQQATLQQVHGPLDWNHFNDKGYARLAEAVAQYHGFNAVGPR